MARILLIALLILVVVFWLKSLARRRGRGDGAAPPSPPPAAQAPSEAPVMVACAHCGLHLPRTETLPGPDGVLYCSEAHRAAASRGTGTDR